MFAERQAQARALVVEQEREDLDGKVRTVASPMRLSRTPASYRLPPPALGADTAAVLEAELGLPPARIAELRANGVV